MKLFQILLAVLTLTVVLGLPGLAAACPSCADAPAAGGDDDENVMGNRLAYNRSIYVMVGVPYLTLAIAGFLIYRGVKQNEAFRRARELAQDPGLAAATPQAS